MDRLLQVLFKAFIRRGNFQLTTSRGTTFTFGDGTGTPVAVRFTSRSAEWALLRDPELKLGEIYMDGGLVVERGSIAEVLEIALGQESEAPQWGRLQFLLRFFKRRLQQFNWRNRSRRNVAHHYDLDGRLYSLFLDADRQYSCAYFESLDETLDDAQLAKKRHLAAKLLVAKDHKILDIGCGWGGLGLYLAEMTAASVTGVTLSQEQFAIANHRAAEKHLSERAVFKLEDYRDVQGPFDRIVSVGMFEHVGVGHYDTFFRKCAELLDDKGVMVLHSIGRSEGPGITNPWIAKYIFPGGYIPALSEVLPAIERAGLLVTDIEILRLHYAETLRHWRHRFIAHREEAEKLYDERFVRMWEFYLAASEMAFRKQNMMNFQIQMTKRQDVVPMTRDYIQRNESRLRAIEGRTPPLLRLAGE
ncbi:MAG: class I SAM-dependent methyltransferase [Xanthobacteraceae bacterium]|uniref:class I SAM-dependent methyltransferase n=1 Tax=Pseudolabrys sp. TaxID=1960880 RepID=UPI003D151C33